MIQFFRPTKRELKSRIEYLENKIEHLQKLNKDLAEKRDADSNGCVSGEWCVACENAAIEQKYSPVTGYYRHAICTLGKCSQFLKKE